MLIKKKYNNVLITNKIEINKKRDKISNILISKATFFKELF